MALKDIKAKIAATNRTHTVTRAMEAVSAAKMRKTQDAALQGRAYARAAVSILARISGTPEMKNHPLAKKQEGNALAILVITSDKGLAGALNSAVLKKAVEALEGRNKEEVTVYAYGKKGEDFFRRRGYTIARSCENASDSVPLSLMEEIATDLSNGFKEGKYQRVVAVYTNFRSTFEQTPTLRRLLPLSMGALHDIVEGIVPAKGKWSNETPLEAPAAYTLESSETRVLDLLVPRLFAVALYHMLLEAKASEHSARMVAMKNASDKSKEIARDLGRIANRIRQAAITREVSEIIGGREALAA